MTTSVYRLTEKEIIYLRTALTGRDSPIMQRPA